MRVSWEVPQGITWTLGQWCTLVFFGDIHVSTSTISPLRCLQPIDDTKSLRVLHELSGVRVVMNITPLSLAAKESFQWVLAYSLTQEQLHIGMVNTYRTSSTKDLPVKMSNYTMSRIMCFDMYMIIMLTGNINP